MLGTSNGGVTFEAQFKELKSKVTNISLCIGIFKIFGLFFLTEINKKTRIRYQKLNLKLKNSK